MFSYLFHLICRKWGATPEYCAEWTNTDTFKEIILSMKMIAHHFPDTLLEALGQLSGSKVHILGFTDNTKKD